MKPKVYSQNLESMLFRCVLDQCSANVHSGMIRLQQWSFLCLGLFFMPSFRDNLVPKCLLKQIGLRHSIKQKLFKTHLANHLNIKLIELGSILWRALKTAMDETVLLLIKLMLQITAELETIKLPMLLPCKKIYICSRGHPKRNPS